MTDSCETCKFWTRQDHEGALFGFCDTEAIEGEPIVPVPFSTRFGGTRNKGEYAALLTCETFGCNEWAERADSQDSVEQGGEG